MSGINESVRVPSPLDPGATAGTIRAAWQATG
jgi:hypothetical protein